MIDERVITGKATYVNRALRQEYKLGFEVSEGETELSRAWDLVNMVAETQGWQPADIFVKAGV